MDEISNRDLIHLLNQRTRLLAKEVNKCLSDHGLYTSQWSIIFCIERFGPMTQTEIWKYLNVEAPTITRTLSRMEKNGWIKRELGKDKRERVINLTEEAWRNYKTIRQSMDNLEHEILSDLSTEEKKHLYNLLKKIRTSGERTT